MTLEHDYTERLVGWNTDGDTAVSLLVTLNRNDDDRDLLAVDWRNAENVTNAAKFITYLGLGYSEVGLPYYEDALYNVHRTHKNKIFFDFVTEFKKDVNVLERRIYLPSEDMVVASLFRATREKIPSWQSSH
ncbi:MAG: hypothetical protein WCJ60_00510 [bacterium]